MRRYSSRVFRVLHLPTVRTAMSVGCRPCILISWNWCRTQSPAIRYAWSTAAIISILQWRVPYCHVERVNCREVFLMTGLSIQVKIFYTPQLYNKDWQVKDYNIVSGPLLLITWDQVACRNWLVRRSPTSSTPYTRISFPFSLPHGHCRSRFSGFTAKRDGVFSNKRRSC